MKETTHTQIYSRELRFRMIAPTYAAFNIYSRIARKTTALGPLNVATMVNHMPGWNAEVIDENNYRRYGPKSKDGRPDHAILNSVRRADVVGLYGGLSSTIPRLYELAKLYKSFGVTTIAGGQHFSAENIRDGLENGIDYIVIGEGEYTICELLHCIQVGDDPADISGIAYMKDGEVLHTTPRVPITEFDLLPLPDYSLLRYAKMTIYPVGWIRGCGMDCEFCTVKGAPRASSPERVVEQITSLVEEYHARQFFIVDDLFGHNRKDTLNFCRMLTRYRKAARVRLHITVQIRLDRARDQEMLEAMREAGVAIVCIGFESPIPEELEAMNKKIKPRDMVELARRYHAAGFLVHGMFIFGYPLPENVHIHMDAHERVKYFKRFIRAARLDSIQVLLPVPLPGTDMTQRLARQGRIFDRETIGWEYYDGNFPLFEPDAPMTPARMQQATRSIMASFYNFHHIFAVARNILIFPAMLAPLWNIRFSWQKWYRIWRNNLLRFGGWLILRKWIAQFRRNPFSQKLALAQKKKHANA